jgi:3-mercaptopyruvate sulfurtransferase SseA
VRTRSRGGAPHEQARSRLRFSARLIRRLKGPRFTDAATLKDRLEAGEKIAIIDVRSGSEFFGPLSHIAGATNITYRGVIRKNPGSEREQGEIDDNHLTNREVLGERGESAFGSRVRASVRFARRDGVLE